MTDIESLVTGYVEVYRQLTRTLDQQMARNGASLARTRLLLFLIKRGPMRAIDIADFLAQAPRTVTQAIDGLERDGLVERLPDPTDRRAKQIRVTASGVDAAAKTEPMRRKIVDQTFGTLNEEEREVLQAILTKLLQSLQTGNPAP
ncbi:MAG: winged helix-turn-helix transcriptional regulator [Novosphingobium sp.]|nr:winged helix-turn-helix transcriptional regulator [Novosphingobium sp.]